MFDFDAHLNKELNEHLDAEWEGTQFTNYIEESYEFVAEVDGKRVFYRDDVGENGHYCWEPSMLGGSEAEGYEILFKYLDELELIELINTLREEA